MTWSPSSAAVGAPPVSEQGRVSRSDLVTVAAAAACWLGADVALAPLKSGPVLVVAVGAIVAALIGRWSPILVAGLFLLGGGLGARADAAYVPMAPGPLPDRVEVVGDPEPRGAGVSIELRLPSGDRVEARGYGRAATALSQASIGQSLEVAGRVGPVGDRRWLRTRHITGIAAIDEARAIGPPLARWAVPEFFRHRVAAGAASLAPQYRSLYLGLIIGDDRSQSLGQRLRFRAAGLSHLLAVSGQNVAFVVAVARPVLQLFGYRGRFVGLVMVLVIFAMITRLEPSVLRATASAGVAAWATLTGRERTGLKLLSVAVIGLVCADPFLVDSVGFQLSVAASAGILLFEPPIEARIPGPGWLTGAVATTAAAQLGVSPLLIAYFGPVSLASLPANVLAGWAAALIMTMGLTVGVVAGLAPDAVGQMLQWPAALLLWWIDAVAGWHARLPAPRLGLFELVAVGGLLTAVRFRSAVGVTRAFGLLVGLLVLISAIPRAPTAAVCGPGVAWYPGAVDRASVLVVTADAYDRSIEDCAAAGVRRADVVIVERGSAATARLVAAMGEVMSIGVMLAPPRHRVVGAYRQLDPLEVVTGSGVLLVEPGEDRSRLTVAMIADS